MSNSTTDPTGPVSATPPSAGAAGGHGSVSRPLAPPTTRPQTASSASSPSSGTRQARGINPVLLVVGGIVLIALIFGGGFLSGRVGARSNDLQQATIGAISAADPSIVEVQAQGSGPGGSTGSGEILTSDGYIVTNSHVIHGMSTFAVLLSTGQKVPAKVVGDVPQQDLAVLKINATNLQPIPVGNSSEVPVGQFVIAMGSPLGLEQSASQGIVSALNREGREHVDGNTYTLTGMIQTSAPINPGNSGGALVNLQGQLIGIPTLSAVDASTNVAANGIGFAISSNQMESVIARFIPEAIQ